MNKWMWLQQMKKGRYIIGIVFGDEMKMIDFITRIKMK